MRQEEVVESLLSVNDAIKEQRFMLMFSFCLQRISCCCEIFCCHLVELMLKVPSLQCSADVPQSLDTLIFSTLLLIPE